MLGRNRTLAAVRDWSVVTTLFLFVACSGATPPKKSGEPMPTRDITAVMNDHVNELMAIPGVTGVAVGALDDGTPCILVLVLKRTDEIANKVPKVIEGHPVKLFESGEIKPMDGN